MAGRTAMAPDAARRRATRLLPACPCLVPPWCHATAATVATARSDNRFDSDRGPQPMTLPVCCRWNCYFPSVS